MRPLFLLLLSCAACTGLPGSAQAAEAQNTAPTPGFAGDFLIAYSAERQSDWQTSLSALQALAARDPHNQEILHRLTLLALNAGDFDTAAAQARPLLTLDTNLHLAQLVSLTEAVRQDNPAEARHLLGQMSRDGMGHYLIPFLSAWLADSPAAAEQALLPVKSMPSLQSFYHLHLALLDTTHGKLRQADAAFLKAAAAMPNFHVMQLAIGHFLKRGEPQRVASLLSAANLGNTISPDLLRELSRSTEMTAPYSRRMGLAEVLYNFATLLQAEGANDVALPYLNLALALRPDFPEARLHAGDLLARTARYSEARTSYQRVAANMPMRDQARLRLAILDAIDGHMAEAAAALSTLASSSPDWAEVWQQLGDAQLAAGHLDEAVTAYTQIITLTSLSAEDRGRALLARSRTHTLRNADDKAEADLEAAVALMPQNASLLNHLGYLWAVGGTRLDEAAGLITRALALDPQNGSILDSLGWLRLQQGQSAEAVRLLENASESLPYDPVVNNHLGDAYWAVGREREARFQWNRALTYRDAPGLETLSIDELRAKIERGPAVQISAERHELQN